MATSQIRKGAILSYAGVAFNAIAGLLYTPWMISCIGADDYGLYTLALSVINFFLLDFGLGDAVSRFMSKYYAEGREDLANSFLGLAYKFYAIVSVGIFLVLLAVFVFIDQIYGNLQPDQLSTFKNLYVIVAAYSIVSFPFVSFNGVLTANEEFIPLNLCNLLQKVFTVLLIVIALLLGAGVYALVAVNAGVGLIIILVKYFVIKRRTHVKPVFRQTTKGLAKEVIGFSFWAMIVQICQRFIFSFMPSVLAIVANAWEIAIFGLASSLEGYVWTVANALNSMFMPKVSRVLAGDTSEGPLQRLTEKLGRIQLFIVGGIVIAFASFGTRFVECWVGAEYSSLYICTLLLIVPAAVDLPLMIANTAIIAAGEVKARGLVYIVMSVANMVLGFILSARYGASGACASICFAYLLRTTGMCYLYKKKLNLDVALFFARVFPRWLLAAVLSFITCFVLSTWLPLTGWLGFFGVCVVFVVVYLCSCWLLYASQHERELARTFMRKKLKKG